MDAKRLWKKNKDLVAFESGGRVHFEDNGGTVVVSRAKLGDQVGSSPSTPPPCFSSSLLSPLFLLFSLLEDSPPPQGVWACVASVSWGSDEIEYRVDVRQRAPE